MFRRQFAALVLLFTLLAPFAAFGQQPQGPQQPAPDPNDPIVRIKDEGMNRSQVMQTLSYLSDVIGPRLTASPNMKRACEWTRDTMTKWGLQNAHLEAWGRFGGNRNPDFLAQAQFAAKKNQFFVDEGAALLVDSSRGDGGTIFVQSATVPQPFSPNAFGPNAPRRINPYDKDAPKIVPQMVVAVEHYNRIARMIQAGEKVKMEVNLAVEWQDQDLSGYNTVAEIPGSDPQLKDELVMLGGHMDSWHSGTGATDNGAGVAVGMEAVRIIQTLGLKPRRTIRIALWTGEEEGLLGSRAYVAQHFGRPETSTTAATPPAASDGATATPRRGGSDGNAVASPGPAPAPALIKMPEYDKLAGYFNLDNGTGKIRGVYLQGNESIAGLFRQWLAQFRDLGAETLSLSNTGGTDHLSFDGIGLPGFQFIQDEIEYDSRTHHSNMDVFDRIQADDMKQAATIMAAFVYNTAMRDDKLPRKSAPGR